MELSEFAEQIVFAKTIEEKLFAPSGLTDSTPQQFGYVRGSGSAPLNPGRPIGLEMHHSHGVSQPPTDRELENEQARGRLLHFLANHELLATELMALVLLKFPDAPAAFRRGVFVTLREEQEHTKLYLSRLQELGIEFGSFPLSGHFWRIVEPMKSPMDFVSRLSLTFEQANLDYSRHFAAVFRRIGDDDTAEILERIYQDEIGHVRHGLEWFRQWKDPEKSDWDAFQEQLQFPMSPQRARGPRCAFNRPGRQEAGLTDDFIDAVELFRQSRGRPPVVRWFDASAEEALAQQKPEVRPNRQHNVLMDQLSCDLELLLVAISKQDDVQMVHRIPTQSFRKNLLQAGFELPEYVLLSEQESLSNRKLDSFEPWAWTPNSHALTNPLMPATREAPPNFGQSDLSLYRKSWAAERLGRWLAEHAAGDFVDATCAGRHVTSMAELSAACAEFSAAGFDRVIAKRDFGNSGRSQRRLNLGEEQPAEDSTFLRGMFAKHDCGIVVEPELDRLLDVSFLWNTNAEGELRFLGWSRQLISNGRRYMGARLSRPFEDCDPEMKRFLLEDTCGRLNQCVQWLEKRIRPELLAHGFSGYFGVDALVCRWRDGSLKLKPLVELNPRMTMGHIALALSKRLAPAVFAELQILTASEYQQRKAELDARPLGLTKDGYWASGVAYLSEFDAAYSKLVPLVVVGTD